MSTTTSLLCLNCEYIVFYSEFMSKSVSLIFWYSTHVNLETCSKDIYVAQQIALKLDRCLAGDKWAMSSLLLAAWPFFVYNMSVLDACIVAPPMDTLRFTPPIECLARCLLYTFESWMDFFLNCRELHAQLWVNLGASSDLAVMHIWGIQTFDWNAKKMP